MFLFMRLLPERHSSVLKWTLALALQPGLELPFGLQGSQVECKQAELMLTHKIFVSIEASKIRSLPGGLL